MASLTALFTGLQGLNVHARRLDVIGNNIANVNTTAFKSSRMMFENASSRDVKIGSAPADTTGGTNPHQIGLGVSIAGVQRDFRTGALDNTGDPRDLAIDGSGFFIVQRAGTTMYTRAGNFRQDLNDNLVTPTGEWLMGYGVNADFAVQEGALVPVNVPLGKLRLAEATTNATVAGNLNTDGVVPSRGSTVNLLGTATAGLIALSTSTPAPSAGNRIELTTRLTQIRDPGITLTESPLFEVGQTLSMSGAQKGLSSIPERSLEITETTTVADLMDFLRVALGLHDTGSPNPNGQTPGVTLDSQTGVISIVGNTGTINDLDIESADLRVLDASGAFVRVPFVTSKSAAADGEAVRTTMVVYDSLGSVTSLDVSFVLDSKTTAGTHWRYFIEGNDSLGEQLDLGTGIISFDPFGRLVTDTPVTVSLSRNGTGAVTPLTFDVSFTGAAGRLTALADRPSEVAGVWRDGLPAGVLANFVVADNGDVLGAFDNGAIRTLGRVVLAKVPNDAGMVDVGGNAWAIGPNSGPASVVSPGAVGSGWIVSGALEMSNVDLGQEFINLITTSTGYSASSRVIRTTDELMQQLLVLGR
ncbi:MAG: flagellar hook-basal body complex protein [Phycisphaeraceae bacterium]|nr:flagellar hook-basal body complex protein [Phycisphaeraceae bacterium]MCW5762609.1 flagellar hook-basal body complex protein [Phycisphaeraceae bacterium]